MHNLDMKTTRAFTLLFLVIGVISFGQVELKWHRPELLSQPNLNKERNKNFNGFNKLVAKAELTKSEKEELELLSKDYDEIIESMMTPL